ncbi:MAG: hypothetical protein R2867_01315 [Caldilineaceae bacterium]
MGERILGYLHIETHPLMMLLVGATVATGSITFVWAIGGCMRPAAHLITLTLTALAGGSSRLHRQEQREQTIGYGVTLGFLFVSVTYVSSACHALGLIGD